MRLTAAFPGRHPMTSNRQNGAASIRALLGMVMIGIAAHAGLPYLPLTGPPPLRVAAARPSATAAVIALEKSAAKSSSPNNFTNTPAAAETAALVSTNSASAPEAAQNIPDAPLVGTTAGPADGTVGVPVFNLPEQGLMTITPQMLATYFRPVSFGTNGGVIAGVLPIGFVPPFTRLESSRAEYIVK